MTVLTYKTYGGNPWIPQYVKSVDEDKCLGCGRCVKVCAQQCLSLESYVDEDDTERYIAAISNRDNCIGCQSCGKTCVRGCYEYETLSA